MIRCALVMLCIAGVAHADSRENIVLRYAAPAECPDRAAFVSAIRARTTAFELGEAGRAFAVEIVHKDDAFVGAVSTDGGEPRSLSASRCDDLVTALALISALAIDPAAVVAPHASPWQIDALAAGTIDTGVSPDVMPGAGVEIAARRDMWRLALAALGGHDRATLDMGDATFWWLATRASVCRPTSWHGSELSGCAHVEIGATRARGEDVALGRALTRLWAAGGVHGAASWPMTSAMFAQLQVGLSIPATRDRYLFQPNVTIHETSLVTMWVSLGVGVRFR